jgi:hypothetical protein
MIALPTMLRSGYDPRVASGIVCTAGTLGQIIPPSTLLIILADVMSNAYQQAQYEQGKFAVEALSVGQFFAAAIIPGLMLVVLYMAYVLLRAWADPDRCRPPRWTRQSPRAEDRAAAIVPPIILIVAVLGAILGGSRRRPKPPRWAPSARCSWPTGLAEPRLIGSSHWAPRGWWRWRCRPVWPGAAAAQRCSAACRWRRRPMPGWRFSGRWRFSRRCGGPGGRGC